MTRRRPTRPAAWAVLALGVLVFAGDPPTAAASCGDYVHIHAPGQSDADAAPAKPCRGPGCHQAPSAPVPAPPPAPTTVSLLDAILSALLPPQPVGGGWVRTEPSHSPRHATTAIFHPPRV